MIFGLSLFGKKKEDKSKEEGHQELSGKKSAEEEDLILILKRAKLAEMKREFAESDKLYHTALGLLNIYHQNNTWQSARILQARVYIFDGMANLSFVRGNLETAERLFKETIRGLLQQGYKQDHDAVVEISLKLAMIYAAQQRNEDALQGYKFCIQTQEKKMKEMNPVDDNTLALLGMSLDAYSRFLIVQKRYDEALVNMERALDIAIKALGSEEHPQVVILLNDIATIVSLIDNFDLAKEKLQNAIKIAEKVDSSDLAILYCNLGAVHIRKSNFKEAKIEYDKALRLALKNGDKSIQKKARDGLDAIKSTK